MVEHIVFWVGAVADWGTTRRGLKEGLSEKNPLVKKLMERLGRDWGMSLLKMILWLTFYLSKAPPMVFYFAGGVQLAAAAWNWNVVRKWKN